MTRITIYQWGIYDELLNFPISGINLLSVALSLSAINLYLAERLFFKLTTVLQTGKKTDWN